MIANTHRAGLWGRRAIAFSLVCALVLNGAPVRSLGEELPTNVPAQGEAAGQDVSGVAAAGDAGAPMEDAPAPQEPSGAAQEDVAPVAGDEDISSQSFDPIVDEVAAPSPAATADAPVALPPVPVTQVVPATAGEVIATVRLIGPDATGAPVSWIEEVHVTLPAGDNAWEASERAFSERGLAPDEGYVAYGDYLSEVTSPLTGTTLGWDEQTGRYWQLFIGDVASDRGAGSVAIDSDTTITWFYSSYGESLPTDSPTDGPSAEPDDGIKVIPDAERPAFEATWDAPQLGNVDGGAQVSASTPTDRADAAWSLPLCEEGTYVNCSTPIIVNGHMLLAVDDELRMISLGDGQVVRTARLASTIGINAPIAYDDGIVVVALLDGRLQALTADDLVTVWLADPFGHASYGAYDPAPGLALHAGHAYVTRFGALDENWTATGGRMACVSLADGSLRWLSDVLDEGFYANGITFVRDFGVATSDIGHVFTFDLSSGRRVDTFAVDGTARIRSAPVADSAGNVYVSASDGTLHKLGFGQGGTMTRLAMHRFADASSSTPTIVGERVFVGGLKGAAGLIAVLNANSLAPLASITCADGSELAGNVQCAPLVASNAVGTSAYFTCNALPGGVFAYRLGDAEAHALFMPPRRYANYCWYSVVADEEGALYYTNDSYVMFKLVASDPGGSASGDVPADDGAAGGPVDTGAGNASKGGRTTRPTAQSSSVRRSLSRAEAGGNRSRVTARRTSRPAVRDSSDGRGRRTADDGEDSRDLVDAEHGQRDRSPRGDVGASVADEATAGSRPVASVTEGIPVGDSSGQGIGPAVATGGVVCGLAAIVALVWWLRRLMGDKGQ